MVLQWCKQDLYRMIELAKGYACGYAVMFINLMLVTEFIFGIAVMWMRHVLVKGYTYDFAVMLIRLMLVTQFTLGFAVM